MSFEFFAPLPRATMLDLTRVANAVNRQLSLELISGEPARLSLRWQASPDRLEDVAIERHSDAVSLVIHAGTRTQRAQLLECIAREISAVTGTAISFEEE